MLKGEWVILNSVLVSTEATGSSTYTRILKEMCIVINEIKNALEHFVKDLEQCKIKNAARSNKLERLLISEIENLHEEIAACENKVGAGNLHKEVLPT